MSARVPDEHSRTCGKRSRSDAEAAQQASSSEPLPNPNGQEPSAKVPRSHAAAVHSKNGEKSTDDASTSGDQANNELPLAPQLADFMAPGGTTRFRARPEWYCTTLPETNQRKAGRSGYGQFAREENPQFHQAQARLLHEGRENINEVVADERGIAILNEVLFPVQPQLVRWDNPFPVARNNGLLVAPVNGLLPACTFQEFLPRRQNNDVPAVQIDRAAVRSRHANHVEVRQAESSRHDGTDEENTMLASNSTNQNTPANVNRLENISAATSTTTPQHHPGEDGESNKSSEDKTDPARQQVKLSTFGKDSDTALHMAIRENATEAALRLIKLGASVDAENGKGITASMLASQKGQHDVVKALLLHGANPANMSVNGTTAVMQAAHFGHGEVLDLLLQHGGNQLMEVANHNQTTPLMRAAQEGHIHVVRALLGRGAGVNRRNRDQMTALMLASQRGHADICSLLVKHGADLDTMTEQYSTSLLLACKRAKVDVVRVLVTAGCELWVKDARGRTARDVARRRGLKELVNTLDSNVQINLMQREARTVRNFDIVRYWTLLQSERATVKVEEHNYVKIHELVRTMNHPQLKLQLPFALTQKSTQALVRTMTLPAPLVQAIARFIPLPLLWEKRLSMLARSGLCNADFAIMSIMDLIDEILEEGGFIEACHEGNVTPPTKFENWLEWKCYCRSRESHCGSWPDNIDRPVVTTAVVPPPNDPNSPSAVECRRQVGFLQLLANRSTRLSQVLTNPPFNMPSSILLQLITSSDIQSVVRRMGPRHVHFDANIAMDLILLASRLSSWYYREREI